MRGAKNITVSKQCPIFLILGLSCFQEHSLTNTELPIFLTSIALAWSLKPF